MKREFKNTKTNTTVNETVINENVEEKIEEVIKEPIIVTVDGCSALNLRAKANTSADVLKVLTAGTKLTVCDKGSTKDFYKVTLVDGTIGFVMKQFTK